MARFDVYEYSDDVPLLLDVQADLFSTLKTRVVVPLLPNASTKLARLNPTITVQGKAYVLMTTDIAALPTGSLGTVIANVEDQRQVVIDALDFLLQGF